MSDTPATTGQIPPPPPCPSCGALPLADHAADCGMLSAIRAQEFPTVIDRNGMPWYVNALRERESAIPLSVHQAALDENDRLRSVIEELRKRLSDWEGRMVDVG